MFRKFMCLLVITGTICTSPGILNAKDWSIISGGDGGEYEIISKSRESFELRLHRNTAVEKAWAMAIRDLNITAPSNTVIAFSCNPGTEYPVGMRVLISVKRDGKTELLFGPKQSISGKEDKFFSFDLNTIFKISTGEKLYQLKISVDISEAPSDSETKIVFDQISVISGNNNNKACSKDKVEYFPVAEQNPQSDKLSKTSDWIVVAPAKGGDYDLVSISPEEFILNIKRNEEEGKAAVQICRTIDKKIHTQSKLLFSCRAVNDNPVTGRILLSYRENGKSVMKFGENFEIKGKSFKNYSMGIDSEFKLGDAVYDIWQLKFSAFIGSAEPGTKAGIEVQNLRITSSEEAGAMSGRSEVIVYPNSKHAIKSTNDMMKIYFHFDNEDYSTIFHRRKKDKLKYEDNCQYPGFRDMLLETVRDQTIIVTDPKDADVIVYSGARPDPADAGRIAEAVKNGTPLFSAGVINDPVIAALLPGKISILPNTGIPDRLRLKPVNTDDPLFIGLNSMEFGIYLNILPDQDSHVLLSYANGSPAIIENKSNKSKIIYSAIAIGADLIPGKKAYDPFLLRVLSYLSGKKIREENEAVINSINGFYAGFTEENFGRFGFTLSDGLLVESINSSLHVINGAQEYSFSSGLTPKITLSKWSITSINAKPEEPKREINHLYKYLGIGKFELLAKCIIPKDWSSKSVFFSVESGIDDIAEVYFNNMLIGRVTTNMPEYWMRPHYYAVNSSLIRFGEKNEILIKTENLRGEGGFGSCPELLAFSGTGEAWKFVPDRINCLGKGGVITEHDGSSRRFDTSLAFPGVRWEIFSDSVDIALQNIASFAAFQSGNKINIVDLSGTKNLPTDWSAPWLLLFRKGKEHPLLLVFDQKPSQIKIKHTGEAVAGISIERKGGAGMILPLWLYGTASVDSIEWNKSIPEETLARIAFWYPRAFLYPVELDEKFHIDEASGQIAIRSEYRYKKATGEWSDKNVKPYAPVSPLAFFMKGKLFESSTVKDFNLVTSFGNYAACDGSDTAEWTLPLPSPDLSVIPAISGFEKVREIVNMVFSSAVCFSAGGGAKISDWTPAFPQGTENPTIFNINMHGYLAGLNQTMGMPYLLDEENSAALKKRVRERIFEPIELYRYKSAQRWREEPMSGIRYPVFYNSYYVHTTKYAEGFGSSMNYGDQNETAHMILAVMQALADRFGQRDFVLANRNFIYHAARILLVSDDWAYMSCHCRESGLSATIDMLNCEYSSMMKLARLAEIIGDKALRAQALYRGSRRMVPTLARFYFREYAINNNLVDYPENIATCVGFTEQGMHYRTKGTLPNMLDLYDMSQGIPSDIIPLYQRFLHKAQENYFKNIVFPTLFNKEGEYSLDTTMLSIIAQDSVIESSILEKAVISLLKHEKKIKKLSSDWPGMTLVPDIAQVLYKLHGVVKIKSIKNSELKVFKYDPKLKILYIKFVPETQAELILQSRLAPADPSFKVDPLGCITITTGPVGKEQDIVIHF